MRPASSGRVSKLLINWGHGDQDAREALIPLVYDELRCVARRHLGRERPDHILHQCRVIELRFFRGLSIEETAVVLGISPAAVKRGWATFRAWLRGEMKDRDARQ